LQDSARELVEAVKQNSSFILDKAFLIGHEAIIDYNNISLEHIVSTSHPYRVLFIYKIGRGYNSFIWDVEKDKEIESFASRDNDTLLFYTQPPKQQVYEGLINDHIRHLSKQSQKKGNKEDG
jgi:hypothetical protein